MLKRNVIELSEAGQWYRAVSEWRRHVQDMNDKGLTVTDRFIGCYIADRISRAGDDMWYMQETMALKIGVSHDTVSRAIKKLEVAKVLRVVRGRRGVKRAVNRYVLLYPWV